MTLSLSLTDDPAPADLATLGDGLTAFNAELFGLAHRRNLALFLRDDGGAVQGGLWGNTSWDWLYVQWLWLAPAHRGLGLAAQLLAGAEAEARARGCIGAWIDTFSPAAARVYQRAGYQPFGQLTDFPPGHARTFLQKSLRAEE
jgi:GNAT superfamily N-acetyltransferase